MFSVCPTGGSVNDTVVDEPEHGSLTQLLDFNAFVFRYEPTAGFVGDDTFMIRRTETCGTPPNPTQLFERYTLVLAHVVDPNRPFALGQSLSVNEDTPLPVTLTGISQNAAPLTFAVLAGPAHGTLSGTPPNVIYTPAPNYHGPDSFTFEARDTRTNSAPATISITVLPVNDLRLLQRCSHRSSSFPTSPCSSCSRSMARTLSSCSMDRSPAIRTATRSPLPGL